MNVTEHLLTCLIEESSEVIKDSSKSLRFGLYDRNVLNPNGPTNSERLIEELNDIIAIIEMLVEYEIIPKYWEDSSKKRIKKDKVIKFMTYAKKVGTL